MLTERDARQYVESLLPAEPVSLRNPRRQPDELGLPHHEMFPSQVAFLQCYIAAANIRNVLELGTFLGYSTVAIAQAMDWRGGGRVTTVDLDADAMAHARRNVADASLASTVRFMVTDASSACAELRKGGETFDMVFLDVLESEYARLLEVCLDLLAPNGTLMVDNVLMATEAGWDSEANVIQGTGPEIAEIRRFLKLLTTDSRVVSSILPVGSGIAIAVKR